MCPDRNKKSDNITPVLHQLHWLQLHWLPVHQRITFKLAMITFKCLHGLAPSYLADVCIPVSSVVGRWQLRLAETFVMPHTRTTISQRDFAVSGPGHVEQPSHRTADFTVYPDVCKKIQKSFIPLLAPLKTLV